MIEEHGKVVEVKAGTVIVKTKKSVSCESCASKEACFSSDEEDMIVEADNPVGATVGDEVLFDVAASTILKAGALVYLVPLIFFIVGVVLGQVFGPDYFPDIDTDLVSAGLGFLFLLAAFVFIRIYARRAEDNKGFRPTVTKIIG